MIFIAVTTGFIAESVRENITNDPQKIIVFFNKVSMERGWTKNYLRNMSVEIPVVNNLRTFLKTEYNIDE